MPKYEIEVVETNKETYSSGVDWSIPFIGKFLPNHGPDVNALHNGDGGTQFSLQNDELRAHVGESKFHLKKRKFDMPYYVGIVSSKSNKLKLVPLNFFTIYPESFHKFQKSRIELSNSLEAVTIHDENQKSYTAKKIELTSTFGPARNKSKLKNAIINAVTSDKIDERDKKTLEITVKQSLQEQSGKETSEQYSEEIPPFDMSTSDVRQCYPLRGIIAFHEWPFFEDKAQEFYKGINDHGFEAFRAQVQSFDEYLVKCMGSLAIIPFHEVREKCMATIYLNYLLQINKLPKYINLTDIDTYENSFGCPKETLLRLIHLFYEPNIVGRNKLKSPMVRSSGGQIRLYNYAIILWLHVNDFKSDPTSIASALDASISKILLCCKYLGCKTSRRGKGEKTTFYVQLSAPLKFPEERKKKSAIRSLQ